MMDIAQAFFDRLAERGYEPLLHNASGSIHLDIQDEGSWLVVMEHGSLTVSRDTAPADCVTACRKEDFERMVVGKQNPTTLYLQGKVDVTGNSALLHLFLRLFPDEAMAAAQAALTM